VVKDMFILVTCFLSYYTQSEIAEKRKEERISPG